MTTETFEIPVLLIPTDDGVTAVAAGSPAPGWSDLAEVGVQAARDLLRGRGATAPDAASVRHFVMREEDLAGWDTLKRLSRENGYALGTLHSKDGKFAKNVALKEVAPAPTGAMSRPIDPTALANAAALAQVQAAIERLTERIEELATAVEWTNEFLAAWQEGEVLAALETLVEVHERYRRSGAVGSVDLARVVHLEQLLKAQHRRIIKELTQVARKMNFRSFNEAKDAARLNDQRVANLVALESYVLRGLAFHAELMLVAKAQDNQLALEEVREATAIMRRSLRDARLAAERLTSARTRMKTRGWFEQLMTHGLIGGALRDDEVAKAAGRKRRAIRAAIEPWALDALDDVGVLALEPPAALPAVEACAEVEPVV